MSAPPITLMVITSMLSSCSWTYLFVFQLAPYGLTIVPSFLLFPAIIRDHYYVQSYCSPFFIVPSLA
jgi:hypothetical protein